jgi:hypothetical protein
MATTKLERSEWRQFFDAAAKQLPKMRVTISVMAEDLGVQPETQRGELIGITYDSKDGCLEIITPSMTHQIANPTEIFVQEEQGELASIEVLAPDGTKQIIELEAID